MIANLTQARDELMARLAASVTAFPEMQQVYADVRADTPDGQSATPSVPAGVTWMCGRVDFTNGEPVSIGGSVGNRRKSYAGTLFANVFTPAGDGHREADLICQAIMTGFDSGGPTAGGIEFQKSVPRDLGRNGAWQETAVMVDFTFEMLI